MFGKKRVQKNIKKRLAEEEQPQDADEGPHETDDAVVPASIAEKKLGYCSKQTTKKSQEDSADLDPESGLISTKQIYESDRSLGLGRDQRATATADYDTEKDRDHRAILERNEAIGKALLAGELEEGLYRGLGAVRPAVNRREGAIAAGKSTGHYGPVRGNQHVRMTMRIDLNPEICKDYKETGYCGFGDTCIFLHDRSDYKSGWQLEKEWEQQQKAKQARDARRLRRLERRLRREAGEAVNSDTESGSGSDSGSESSGDDIPKTCQICQTKWALERRPVVTTCKHYFCETCALKHYGTSSKCFVCREPTHGVFNTASLVIARINEADAG